MLQAKPICKQEGQPKPKSKQEGQPKPRKPRGKKKSEVIEVDTPPGVERDTPPGVEPITLESIKALLLDMIKENLPRPTSVAVPPVTDKNKVLSDPEQPKVNVAEQSKVNVTVPPTGVNEAETNDLSAIKQSNLLLQAEVAKLRQSISEAQPVLAKVLRVSQSGNNLSGSNDLQLATTSNKQQRQLLLEDCSSPLQHVQSSPNSSPNILQYHFMVEQQMSQQQQYFDQQLLQQQHKQARVQLLNRLLL